MRYENEHKEGQLMRSIITIARALWNACMVPIWIFGAVEWRVSFGKSHIVTDWADDICYNRKLWFDPHEWVLPEDLADGHPNLTDVTVIRGVGSFGVIGISNQSIALFDYVQDVPRWIYTTKLSRKIIFKPGIAKSYTFLKMNEDDSMNSVVKMIIDSYPWLDNTEVEARYKFSHIPIFNMDRCAKLIPSAYVPYLQRYFNNNSFHETGVPKQLDTPILRHLLGLSGESDYATAASNHFAPLCDPDSRSKIFIRRLVRCESAKEVTLLVFGKDAVRKDTTRATMSNSVDALLLVYLLRIYSTQELGERLTTKDLLKFLQELNGRNMLCKPDEMVSFIKNSRPSAIRDLLSKILSTAIEYSEKEPVQLPESIHVLLHIEGMLEEMPVKSLEKYREELMSRDVNTLQKYHDKLTIVYNRQLLENFDPSESEKADWNHAIEQNKKFIKKTESCNVNGLTLRIAKDINEPLTWGLEMQHCIASYAHLVWRCDALLGGVYQGDNLLGNFDLQKNSFRLKTGNWKLNGLRGKNNEIISKETAAIVEEILRKQKVKIKSYDGQIR